MSNRDIDPARLWAGGAATAVVAALVAVVGILIARGILHIPILAPQANGAWGSANTMTYALGAGACALLATGLMHLLILATPNPTSFFGWILALATLTAVVMPLGLFAVLDERIATAAINLAIGLCITFLLLSTASSAMRRRPPETGTYPTAQFGR